MKAVNFNQIKIGDKILVDFPDTAGCPSYTTLEVREVDEEDHSVVSNMNFGLNIYPNEDNQYILVEYEGEKTQHEN